MLDMKMTDQFAGHEIAGHEIMASCGLSAYALHF